MAAVVEDGPERTLTGPRKDGRSTMTDHSISPSPLPGGGKPWWKGARGEWLVVLQVALIALVIFGPRTIAGQPSWPFPLPQACRVLGVLLVAGGGGLLLAGLLRMGRALTPLPYPKEGGRLLQTGPYALVRHPMYGGGLVLALGWALWTRSWLALGYGFILFVFLDLKSRREERWLIERFPEYADYRRRVRKLVPFVY
jgi:protein-S-isoprenylcysteine O-methyltransferase Ste14